MTVNSYVNNTLAFIHRNRLDSVSFCKTDKDTAQAYTDGIHLQASADDYAEIVNSITYGADMTSINPTRHFGFCWYDIDDPMTLDSYKMLCTISQHPSYTVLKEVR